MNKNKHKQPRPSHVLTWSGWLEEWPTSVSGFVAQQHLHLPVLLQRLQQDVALLVEEEEEWQADVVRAAAVSRHLEEGSRVAAAALVVI